LNQQGYEAIRAASLAEALLALANTSFAVTFVDPGVAATEGRPLVETLTAQARHPGRIIVWSNDGHTDAPIDAPSHGADGIVHIDRETLSQVFRDAIPSLRPWDGGGWGDGLTGWRRREVALWRSSKMQAVSEISGESRGAM
jgi:DNA-binding NarL/FixJ family response regulator